MAIMGVFHAFNVFKDAHKRSKIANRLRTQPGSSIHALAPTMATTSNASGAHLSSSAVVEGRSRLMPTCAHGRGKDVDRLDNRFSCIASPTKECNIGKVTLPEGQLEEFRIKTTNAEQDLRWALGDAGADKNTMEKYVGDVRFSEQNLRDGILFGVECLINTHGELVSLANYAGRYNVRTDNLAAEADRGMVELQVQEIAAEGLREEFVLLAFELEYVRGECDKVKKAITAAKFVLARAGGAAELEALRVMGWEDEQILGA
ncbi:hypothetical protein LTR08_003015 [Meristemomyces frigidus]|nr:hypothetical protein LTR08_003015 [Meristemomyces frigidus]